MITRLRGDLVIETAERLHARVAERFPESGLSRVALQVVEEARDADTHAQTLSRPHWPLRVGIVVFVLLTLLFGIMAMVNMHVDEDITEMTFFIQVLEPSLNVVVFAGAALFFLVTIETRLNRGRALKALHQLRSLAHIIDMHQLTKDPERLHHRLVTTTSPTMHLGAFELNRYLNYCSEMLSLTGKIAALYAQHFNDAVVLSAVNEIEDLSTGLARKIWQKIVVLDSILDESDAKAKNAIRIKP